MTAPADRLRQAATRLRGLAEGASVDPTFGHAVADLLDHAAEACGLNRSPYVDDQHRLAHRIAAALGVTDA